MAKRNKGIGSNGRLEIFSLQGKHNGVSGGGSGRGNGNGSGSGRGSGSGSGNCSGSGNGIGSADGRSNNNRGTGSLMKHCNLPAFSEVTYEATRLNYSVLPMHAA